MTQMNHLFKRLGEAGYPPQFVRARLLPSWWRDELASTPAGLWETHALLARHTGIPLETLENPVAPLSNPSFDAKFKRRVSAAETDVRLAASVAVQVSKWAAKGVSSPLRSAVPAQQVRSEILATGVSWVSLESLVSWCWNNGIPVLIMTDLPKPVMDGLATRCDERPVIVVCRSKEHPAWLLFDVAHELGHIMSRHLEKAGELMVDSSLDGDTEEAHEQEATSYGLSVLCGQPTRVRSQAKGRAEVMAQAASTFGAAKQIDPGHLLLNFAKNDPKFFPLAGAALRLLPDARKSGPGIIRQWAEKSVNFEAIPEDHAEFVAKAIGIE
jgi:hypothetical protein